VKRDLLKRSNVGFLATRRGPNATDSGDNYSYGADMNLFLFRNVQATAYFARTESPGKTNGQNSYRGRFEYAGDRYGFSAEHLAIGDQFNPESGYVRRTDFRRSQGEV